MNVVYVTHNGAASALVRSQVLPYLRGLRARGVGIELVTFERGPLKFPDAEFPRAHWHPIVARPGSDILAKAFDFGRGVLTVVSLTRRTRAHVLHARSYLPAAIAWFVSHVTRVPFVFDMRGFLPEEYVEGGHWTASDPRYRVLRLAERLLLRSAREIVVLTHVAAERLRSEDRYARLVRDTPVMVIPCAVDLARFRPLTERDPLPTLVYAGSLGMWYLLDDMLRLYVLARERLPGLRFLILNRGEQELARAALVRHGLDGAAVELRASEFAGMPRALAVAHVGLSLIRPSLSKTGSSPIKVAEYLACGLPVVVNEGQGDLPALIRRYAAGHVMRGLDPADLACAADAIVTLVGDRAARANARHLAEAEYDVAAGVEAYAAVWSRAAGRRGV